MKRSDKYPIFLLIFFLIVFLIAAIKPLYLRDWLLESLLTIITVPVLILTYKKYRLSNTSYTSITILLILHTIGSHYTYSEIPFMAIDSYIGKLFDLSRNHYDRVVHFLFGILIYFLILEIVQRIYKKEANKFLTYLIPVLIITSLGAFYEVLEWIAAISVEPELGIAYLGTQGDQWYAQKDITLKLISSSFMMLFLYFRKKK